MSRHAAKVDANQSALTEFARAHGVQVVLTHRLPGFVDAVWSVRNCIALIEHKDIKGKLTKAQEKLHTELPVQLVRNEADALGVINWLKQKASEK